MSGKDNFLIHLAKIIKEHPAPDWTITVLDENDNKVKQDSDKAFYVFIQHNKSTFAFSFAKDGSLK